MSHPFYATHGVAPAIQIIPTYEFTTEGGGGGGGPFPIDVSGVSYYSLNLETASAKTPYAGQTYYVDMAGVDNRGSNIDLSGLWISSNAGGGGSSNFTAFAGFGVKTTVPATKAPGSEFTVFFTNFPPLVLHTYSSSNHSPIPVSIGLLPQNLSNFESSAPYLYCPPGPQLFGNFQAGANLVTSPSVTFKSDGNNYNVVSSGPASWLGLFNFVAILAFVGGGYGPP
jgi:hypothetical protein